MHTLVLSCTRCIPKVNVRDAGVELGTETWWVYEGRRQHGSDPQEGPTSDYWVQCANCERFREFCFLGVPLVSKSYRPLHQRSTYSIGSHEWWKNKYTVASVLTVICTAESCSKPISNLSSMVTAHTLLLPERSKT